MDELLSEFLTETNESLDVVDLELVKFEKDPNDATIINNIFRLVHTIKGTCGFLELTRLEKLAHASETLLGCFRDGAKITSDSVSLILSSLDRIKHILACIGESGAEPEGSDEDLITQLEEKAARIRDGEEDSGKEAAGITPHEEDILENPEEPQEETPEIQTPDKQEHSDSDDIVAEDEPSAPAAEEPVATVAEKKATPSKEIKKQDDDKDKKKKEPPGGGAPVQNQSIRVNVETLESLMTLVSELVLTRNQLLETVRRHDDSEFKVPLQRLSNVTGELQEEVMKTRMQPIGNAWQKLPRIVRDLGMELDKQINLDMIGAETELDRQVLDLIKDPLTHMVRNSADHGIESTDERRAAGKPENGTIRLSAYHEGGHIIIEIADDGGGLDSNRIKEKILERELVSTEALANMNETQINRFIFHPGFSTAEHVTSVSGRGVGMDVVRTNIELIGGSIDLHSVRGKGTTFQIKIPLTLAIVASLIVECRGQRYAIPQLAVLELVRVRANSDTKIEQIKNTPVLRLRNKLLPLVRLSSLLGDEEEETIENAETDIGFIIVMQVGAHVFGIIVDGVFHTEEIVVKPLSSLLRNLTLFSGNTILGDGSVIMILDPNGLANAISTNSNMSDDELEKNRETQQTDTQCTTSFLLFRAGSPQPKAVPLSLVNRIEELPAETIETCNNSLMVQYRGALMPLVKISKDTVIRETGNQQVIVFSEGERWVGLVVDEFLDVVDEELKIRIGSKVPGIIGSAVISEKATEVMDVQYFLVQAFDDWFDKHTEEGDECNEQNIVFVDDSKFFRELLIPVLQSHGYTTHSFNKASEALDFMKVGVRTDVVITDIEMPEINGFEFARELRASDKFKALPIIALSSHFNHIAADEELSVQAFDSCIGKFDRASLLQELDKIFKENKLRSEKAA